MSLYLFFPPFKDSAFKKLQLILRSSPFLQCSAGVGNGTPLQYSCMENPMEGGAWQAAVHGAAKSQTRLSDFTFTHWRRKWQPTPVFLPGESQGWGSLVGCRLWGRTELDTTEATQQQQQEKAMAPHSSTLTWKIPWMEEPGRLQSMGSLRIGHD